MRRVGGHARHGAAITLLGRGAHAGRGAPRLRLGAVELVAGGRPGGRGAGPPGLGRRPLPPGPAARSLEVGRPRLVAAAHHQHHQLALALDAARCTVFDSSLVPGMEAFMHAQIAATSAGAEAARLTATFDAKATRLGTTGACVRPPGAVDRWAPRPHPGPDLGHEPVPLRPHRHGGGRRARDGLAGRRDPCPARALGASSAGPWFRACWTPPTGSPAAGTAAGGWSPSPPASPPGRGRDPEAGSAASDAGSARRPTGAQTRERVSPSCRHGRLILLRRKATSPWSDCPHPARPTCAGRSPGAASHTDHPVADPPQKRVRQKMSDSALQRAVRASVDEIAGVDGRLRVTQTMAAPGWGDVLFVDVYAKSQCDVLEDLDPAIRKLVAVSADWPFERVTVRWRITR